MMVMMVMRPVDDMFFAVSVRHIPVSSMDAYVTQHFGWSFDVLKWNTNNPTAGWTVNQEQLHIYIRPSHGTQEDTGCQVLEFFFSFASYAVQLAIRVS